MRKIALKTEKESISHNIMPESDTIELPKEALRKPTPLDNLTTLDIVNLRREKSAKIIKWINNTKAFKYSIMCDDVGIDRGNFSRILRKPNAKITLELIAKIEPYISKLGYKP